jgi:hypothetical protein
MNLKKNEVMHTSVCSDLGSGPNSISPAVSF